MGNLGDLTGIKKHYLRKHGEKKWYAVQSDWKEHVKGCGTRAYHCDCGIIFSRFVFNYDLLFLFSI